MTFTPCSALVLEAGQRRRCKLSASRGSNVCWQHQSFSLHLVPPAVPVSMSSVGACGGRCELSQCGRCASEYLRMHPGPISARLAARLSEADEDASTAEDPAVQLSALVERDRVLAAIESLQESGMPEPIQAPCAASLGARLRSSVSDLGESERVSIHAYPKERYVDVYNADPGWLKALITPETLDRVSVYTQWWEEGTLKTERLHSGLTGD